MQKNWGMNKLNNRPYIGLNGITSDYDKHRVASTEAAKRLRKLGYGILFGVQVSEKTQILDIKNKYGTSWYPVGEQIKRATGSCRNLGETVLHINSDQSDPDYMGIFAKYVYERSCVADWDETELGSQYATIANYIGGFQLNRLPWHETDYTPMLERLRKTTRVSRLILQASNLQLNSLRPAEFAKALKGYEARISSVLLDGSSGTGKLLNPQKINEYIDACLDENVGANIAIAGGISPQTFNELIPKIVDSHSKISFDAETGLRDNYDLLSPAKSVFSVERATTILEKSCLLLSK